MRTHHAVRKARSGPGWRKVADDAHFRADTDDNAADSVCEAFGTRSVATPRRELGPTDPARYRQSSGVADVADDNADQQTRPRRQHRIVLLGVEQSRSGFYHSGWRHMMKPTFENMVLHVADRDLSVNYTAEEVERILRDNVVQLQTADLVTEEPMLVTRLGAIDAADLQTLDGLHGIGVVAPMYGDPLAFSSELPPIRLGTSVTRFELEAGLRNLNPADLRIFSA